MITRNGSRLHQAVVAIACSAVLVAWTIAPTAAQSTTRDYPTRPVRLIDAYQPGGGSEVMGRLVGGKLSERWGKQVVLDSRPGAGGILGTDIAAKSQPDGYTLVIGTSGSIAINRGMNPKLPYDAVKDLAAVSQMTAQPMVLVAHPSVRAGSVKELLALVAAKPGSLNYSSSGTGGSGHLAAALFTSMTKTDITHVPYKGSGPAALAVLSGEVQLMFGNSLATVPHLKAGRIKAIAVTSAKRSRALPQVPTIAESGVPGYEAISWNGIFGPSKTPRAVVEQLSADLRAVLALPDVQEKILGMGAEPSGNTPQEFSVFVKQEIDRWGKVIRDNNIRAD